MDEKTLVALVSLCFLSLTSCASTPYGDNDYDQGNKPQSEIYYFSSMVPGLSQVLNEEYSDAAWFGGFFGLAAVGYLNADSIANDRRQSNSVSAYNKSSQSAPQTGSDYRLIYGLLGVGVWIWSYFDGVSSGTRRLESYRQIVIQREARDILVAEEERNETLRKIEAARLERVQIEKQKIDDELAQARMEEERKHQIEIAEVIAKEKRQLIEAQISAQMVRRKSVEDSIQILKAKGSPIAIVIGNLAQAGGDDLCLVVNISGQNISYFAIEFSVAGRPEIFQTETLTAVRNSLELALVVPRLSKALLADGLLVRYIKVVTEDGKEFEEQASGAGKLVIDGREQK